MPITTNHQQTMLQGECRDPNVIGQDRLARLFQRIADHCVMLSRHLMQHEAFFLPNS